MWERVTLKLFLPPQAPILSIFVFIAEHYAIPIANVAPIQKHLIHTLQILQFCNYYVFFFFSCCCCRNVLLRCLFPTTTTTTAAGIVLVPDELLYYDNDLCALVQLLCQVLWRVNGEELLVQGRKHVVWVLLLELAQRLHVHQ